MRAKVAEIDIKLYIEDIWGTDGSDDSSTVDKNIATIRTLLERFLKEHMNVEIVSLPDKAYLSHSGDEWDSKTISYHPLIDGIRLVVGAANNENQQDIPF